MKLEKIEPSPGGFDYAFYCPGCKVHHGVWVNREDRPKWTFNGDMDKPTFRPSILVKWPWKGVDQVCHSYVTDGKIQFLTDCTHELAGQTVELEDIND